MNPNNLNLLSEKRDSLMGLAMLLVVLHHLPVNIPHPFHLADWIHRNGGFGVDIFLLLSGIGLAFSITKCKSLKEYYTRRIVRIFPLYCFVICLVTIIKIHWRAYDINPLGLLFEITTLGHWIGKDSFDWFIPNMVLLYAVFPLLYAAFNRINDTKLSLGGGNHVLRYFMYSSL